MRRILCWFGYHAGPYNPTTKTATCHRCGHERKLDEPVS